MTEKEAQHTGYTIDGGGRRVRTWECAACHREYAQAKPSLFCKECKREYHRYKRARDRGDSHERALSWALKPHRPGDNLKRRVTCAYPPCKVKVKTNMTYALFCKRHDKYRVRYRKLRDKGIDHETALNMAVDNGECIYCRGPVRFADRLFCGRYVCRLARRVYEQELRRGRSSVQAIARALAYVPRKSATAPISREGRSRAISAPRAPGQMTGTA